MISATFWIELFAAMTRPVFAQPTLTKEGKCQFQKVKPFERCVVERAIYELQLADDRQYDIHDGACQRSLSVHRLPSTNLLLLSFDSPCGFRSPTVRPKPYKPKKVDGCSVISSRYRRKPAGIDYREVYDIVGGNECEMSASNTSNYSAILTLFSMLILFKIF
ncbi:unnamed protein product, partial [Mesorhabditis spiculigera]